MPIVTLTVRKPKSAEFKATMFAAVHEALVGIGVNPNDRFHRVFELEEENFQFDPTYPDVQTRRTDDFVLVEILLGTGRSVKLKRQVLATIVERLSKSNFDTENVMVVFHDVAWENWSPAGGRIPNA